MNAHAASMAAKPVRMLNSALGPIESYLGDDANLARDTVESFGDEWEQFSEFNDTELDQIGADYFDMLPEEIVGESTLALDVGCGSGRWTKLIAPKLGRVEAVDPSSAVFVAQKNCRSLPNVRVSQASVANLPFAPGSFDLAFSLGVLHHVPDTAAGIRSCVNMVKPGGYFLVYLYYNLDNRGWVYRGLFGCVNAVRGIVSGLPSALKRAVCDLIALAVYWPMASLAGFVEAVAGRAAAEKIPLNYYRNTRFHIMRNDSRDRFGTPLEQRFSKAQIHRMMEDAGLVDIKFSPKQPFWVALGKKPAL